MTDGYNLLIGKLGRTKEHTSSHTKDFFSFFKKKKTPEQNTKFKRYLPLIEFGPLSNKVGRETYPVIPGG